MAPRRGQVPGSGFRLTVRSWLALTLIWTFVVGCQDREAQPASGTSVVPEAATYPPEPELFVDRAADLGLDFFHFNGMTGELLLEEIMCGGGALVDVDADGDLDAYLPQGQVVGLGKTLADAIVPPRHALPVTGRLYRNDLGADPASLSFSDVTEAMGVITTVYGCGVAVGDMDNDGRPDLYLANLGPNQLLRNLGEGRFEDVTERAGVGDPGSTVSATFLDFDGDDWLDLFVGNNVTFDPTGKTVCYNLTGAVDYCGPGAYPYEPDRLYRNRGDGTFEDVTVSAGLAAAPSRPTLGSLAADFDGDGRVDLYVANDGQPNNLWRNRGDGTFFDEALLVGAAVNMDGQAEASMGVAAGDYDNDGDPDLFMTHLVRETSTLYRNDQQGVFTDVSTGSGLGTPSRSFTSFGTVFFDYDNDGWLDLLVVSGAVTFVPELVAAGDPFPLHQRNQLFRNLGAAEGGGGPRFQEVTERAGRVFDLSEVSRGAAAGDVDNDGDTDVLVVNIDGPARLLVNLAGEANPWLGLRLLSHGRDALGARVLIEREGLPPVWRQVSSDGSYSSASDPRVLVGLGDAPRISRLTVFWPDGSEEAFDPPAIGEYVTLEQGEGRVVRSEH